MQRDHTIAFIFPSFDAAQAARQSLIDANKVDADCIRVDVREDEAGPTEGNFVIGTKRHDGKQTGDYEEQYANPRIDGSVTLFVSCASAEVATEMRSDLLARGAVDLADRTAR